VRATVALILSTGRSVRIVAPPQGAALMMNPNPGSSVRRPNDAAHGVESLLWLAAGAAWAIVALKAWSQTKKLEARRRTFHVSERLLRQVFHEKHP